MKRDRFISPRFIIAFAAILIVLGTIASFTPEIVSASTRMGNSENCTLQVCPEISQTAFPFSIKINYQNGQSKIVPVTGPTQIPPCPPFPSEFPGGTNIPGIEDAGQVVSAQVVGTGPIATRGGPRVFITINGVVLTDQITVYNGIVYIRLRTP